mmetsp:Transcript_105316/g.187201  ORF Transcript_105316/g.187201 Transcript_105316/m.187201 type:complete len:114 (+) Transcript_105316:1131-1472(+)
MSTKAMDGTTAFGLLLNAAMPAGRESIPAPAMFFTRFTVDWVIELNLTSPSAAANLTLPSAWRDTLGVRDEGLEETVGTRNVGLLNEMKNAARIRLPQRRDFLDIRPHGILQL